MSEQMLLGSTSNSTIAPVEPPVTRQRLALAIIVTCQLMLILDATVMNVALPRIATDLDFSSTGLAWVLSSYTLAFGGLLLLGGRAGDMLGRRRLFIGGIALFTAASLSAGFAIGLIVGGLLTELTSWRWVLFINVPFGVAAVLLAPRFVREPERHPARLDLPGAVTASIGVAALVYAFLRTATEGWSDTRALLALGIGVVLLSGFLIIEARTRQPLLPLRLFADRARAAGFANFFLGPAAMMSMFFFLTQFLQDVRGFSALATGFAFLPMAAGMFGMTRLVPQLLPRFGPRPLALIGAGVMIVGLAWLTRLHGDSEYLTALFGPMLLMGVGGGLGFVPLTPVIMATVPPRDAGAAGGVLQTMQQTGATLGLSILVTVFGSAMRGHHGPDALVHGMTTAFGVSVLIASLTFAVALTFPARRS